MLAGRFAPGKRGNDAETRDIDAKGLSVGLIQRQGRWTDRDQRVTRDASRIPVDGRVQALANVGGELCLESGVAGRHVEIKAARDVCRRSGADESPQKENWQVHDLSIVGRCRSAKGRKMRLGGRSR